MEEEEEEVKNYFPIPNPMLWFTKLIILQADMFYNCLVVLLSPFLALLSLLSETFHRAEETKETVESAVHAASKVPSKVIHGSGLLLKKVILGFLGAAYVCMVLIVLLVVAVILGVGLVQFWVEEPVFMREMLHFDYTEVHPEAVFSFDGDGGFDGHRQIINYKKKMGVPVGHTFYVSLVFLMPESDYNRDIGVFQVTVELISRNGNIMSKSSHPCMLRFRSWPIRMMRTFAMGLPLLLGITAETQRIKIAMLKHKEGFLRTEAIRITLIPRAGTHSLPQLYEAEILLKSELPWGKELVRRWKWTFFVWTSLYSYVMLLTILLCCFRPLIIPVITKSSSNDSKQKLEAEEPAEVEERSRDERDISETLRRWQENRSKRKAMLLQSHMPEPVGSSASSMSLSREDTGATLEDEDDDDDDTRDSESVCCRGDVDD